jgi:palmitoyltransferase
VRRAAAEVLLPRSWLPGYADIIVRALEPLAILLLVTLIPLAIGYYTKSVTAAIFERSAAVGLAHTTFGLSLVYAFSRSYYLLVTTPARTTRDVGRAALERAEAEAAAKEGSGKDSLPFGWRRCDRCADAQGRLPKPPLAHHCRVCRACVLRADHHCPWFGGCLGYGNHRHFLLFLFYLSVGCLYACVTTYAVHSSEAVHDAWSYRWDVVVALLGGGLSLALAALLAWHIACLSYGLGTLEMMDRVLGWHGAEEEEEEEEGAEGEERECPRVLPPHVTVASLRDYPYNLGFERNVRVAFDLDDGAPGWWWRLLRVHAAPRRGDGLAFERRDE